MIESFGDVGGHRSPDMVAFTDVVPSLAVREVPTERGVETGLESSMLCFLRISMTYFY